MKLTARETRTTYKVNVRDLVTASGIALAPHQWASLEDANVYNDGPALSGWINVIVHEPDQSVSEVP